MLKNKQAYKYEYSQEDNERIKSAKLKHIVKTLQNYDISKNELEAALV